MRTSSSCSLSQANIDGESIVRLIYLDESGISSNETITVVAGVVIDADKQWKAVSAHIDALIEEYVPKEHQNGFVFHAKDLFHGSHIFNRQKCPPGRRHEALKELVGIPVKFNLPTVYGYNDKTGFEHLYKLHPRRGHKISAWHHAITYSFCAIAAEKYMRDHAGSDEIATLIAENNENAKSAVKNIHSMLRGKNLDSKEEEFLRDIVGNCLPIRKIVDCVHFALKDDAILLQLADACAFVYRRYLEGKPDSIEFADVLTKNNAEMLDPGRNDEGAISGYKILYFTPETSIS